MLHEVIWKPRFLLRYVLICIGELAQLQPTGRKNRKGKASSFLIKYDLKIVHIPASLGQNFIT